MTAIHLTASVQSRVATLHLIVHDLLAVLVVSVVIAMQARHGGLAPRAVSLADRHRLSSMNLVKLKFTVVRVSPNGEVPKRYHREVWGYAVPLEGEEVIEVTTESGHVEKHLNM
jgi:hypothetical protein